MENNLKELIKQTIQKTYNISLDEIKLEIPPKKELGDFAFGAFVLAKDLKKNPNVIAEEISKNLKDFDEIQSVSNEGPYVNIKLSKNIFTKAFLEMYEKNFQEEFKKHGNGENLIVDYIGANVGKPLHIGHMCTPNQGQTIINIHKRLGYNVISDSHIGDWGIIFGKLITAYKMWGDKEKLENDAVNHLFELYVKVSAWADEKGIEGEQKIRDEFKLLSEGNPESVNYWKEFTSYSITNLNKELKRLNVKADFDIGESFYEGIGLPKLQDYPDLKWSMSDVVEELIEKGIAIKNEDNSVGVTFDEKTKLPSCILQKRDGTKGYLASDLACIKYRMNNWNPKKIIYSVDVRQQLHLQQAFEISRLAGWIGQETELFHAYNGFISLKDGAMSTRTGNIIRLEELLDEAESRAKKIILEKRDDIKGEELEDLSRIIGIGAIKYGYLKKSRETDVIFDWDEFMTFEGNSGPYIQYSYVRALKILDRADFVSPKIPLSPTLSPQGRKGVTQKENFENNEEINLVKLLLDYENILLETAEKNMPHILCKYAYDLTKAFNALYNNIHILSEENENIKILRLKLVQYYSFVLKDVFGLLAIEMPERM